MHAAHFDERFSEPKAGPTPWEEVEQRLSAAELYWLTTVREDGRPHVTPLVAVLVDGAPHFCTGLEEQKGHNLRVNDAVALTTGTRSWERGLDVVVEGRAVRISDDAALRRIADAYDTKYAGDWHFDVRAGNFHHGESGAAGVFRIEPSKVLAFAKHPHGQTVFTF